MKAVVINLDRSASRLASFQREEWPWEVERVSAVDGKRLRPPEKWMQGRGDRDGAWGCWWSHMLVWAGVREPTVVLEDDAVPVDLFEEKLAAFWREVPEDWDVVFLGGQHVTVERGQEQISERVVRAEGVGRTHAYVIRPEAVEKVWGEVGTFGGEKGQHIDNWWSTRVLPRLNVYCPVDWLVVQRAGESTITGRSMPVQAFQGDKRDFRPVRVFDTPCSQVEEVREWAEENGGWVPDNLDRWMAQWGLSRCAQKSDVKPSIFRKELERAVCGWRRKCPSDSTVCLVDSRWSVLPEVPYERRTVGEGVGMEGASKAQWGRMLERSAFPPLSVQCEGDGVVKWALLKGSDTCR